MLSAPFLEEYERLITRFGTDFTAVDHTRLDHADYQEMIEALRALFGRFSGGRRGGD